MLVFWQTGCVGYISQQTASQTYTYLALGEERGLMALSAHKPLTPCTERFFLSKWGEPDRREKARTDSEIWTYKHGYRWAGFAPILIIPIPFLLPVGPEEVHFEILNGAIITIRHDTATRTVFMFPLLNESNIIAGINNTPSSEAQSCEYRRGTKT